MKPLRVSEDVVPIAEFKGQAARWFKRTAESGQPLLITQNGKPAGVLLSPVEYDRLMERQRLLGELAEGLSDLEAGRVFTTAEVRETLGPARKASRK